MNEYIIRKLNNYDFNKNYINLLIQLTNVGNIQYSQFEKQLNIINSNPYHYIYVIEKNNKIICSGTLLIEPKFIHETSYVGHIEDIVVDNKYSGQGYGKIIVNYLIDLAKNNKCYKVILNCSPELKDFYSKFNMFNKNIEMSLYL
tara:strand:+ start:734 stop:1168 length:435 start_codon:yes stop_codon:yes gene_type:complete